MGYSRFRTGLILRLIIFSLLLVAGTLLFCLTAWTITPLLLFAGALVAAVLLVHHAGKPERNFYAFLQAIRYRDFTYLQTIRKRGAHKHYHTLFTEVMDELRQLKAKQEAYIESIHLVLQQLEAGVVCYAKESGKIMIINPAALAIFNRPYLTHFHTLQHAASGVYEKLLHPGDEHPVLIRTTVDGKAVICTVQAREFKLQGEPMRLLVLQNIRDELDTQELESWQKLISVLTHEMMNSITPVISLAEVIADTLRDDMLERIRRGELGAEALEELRLSATIIRNRSENLLRFVHTYRQMTKVPMPVRRDTDLRDICMHAEQLFQIQARQEQAHLILELPDVPVMVSADRVQVEQVLINLVKNALEAVRTEAVREIRVSVQVSPSPRVLVADTGPGMTDEVLQQIFIPFFTTKAQGSGIGLSLSRQIMRLHGGAIYVKTIPGAGSEFTLEF